MGQGIAKSDYEAARKGFQAVCKNDKASVEDKAFAQFRLGVMDYSVRVQDNAFTKQHEKLFGRVVIARMCRMSIRRLLNLCSLK